VLIAIVLSLVLHDIQYGPQAALIAESFGTNLRYSGAGIGYQLASVIAGGPAPLIAAAILNTPTPAPRSAGTSSDAAPSPPSVFVAAVESGAIAQRDARRHRVALTAVGGSRLERQVLENP